MSLNAKHQFSLNEYFFAFLEELKNSDERVVRSIEPNQDPVNYHSKPVVQLGVSEMNSNNPRITFGVPSPMNYRVKTAETDFQLAKFGIHWWFRGHRYSGSYQCNIVYLIQNPG